MELFHQDVVFEDWLGNRIEGKGKLTAVWRRWFDNHGDFKFELHDIFVDKESQQALMRWRLYWPSPEREYRGLPEIREGLDVLRFRNGLIDMKLTYTMGVAEIGGKKHIFRPVEPGYPIK